MADLVPQRVRAYIYRIITAVQPLIVAYGLAKESEIALWVSAISAVLGGGLAAANTSTAKLPKDDAGQSPIGITILVSLICSVLVVCVFIVFFGLKRS